MELVYYIIGSSVFWLLVGAAVYMGCTMLYYRVWQKIKDRLWVYQVWETYKMWSDWRHKDYSKIIHWGIVERVRADLDKRPHIFKSYWIKTLDHMLQSPEYNKYKTEQTQDYDND